MYMLTKHRDSYLYCKIVRAYILLSNQSIHSYSFNKLSVMVSWLLVEADVSTSARPIGVV